MNTNGLPPDPPGREYFSHNRSRQPLDITDPYFGKYVAWKIDGTAIVASGKTLPELDDNLIALGIDPGFTVLEYVPDPDEPSDIPWH